MMIKKLSLCLFLLLPLSLKAATTEWTVIPAESHLSFTATQNNAPVTAEFKNFSAKIFADPNDLKDSSLDIIIDMNSLNTSYADLRTTLLTPDWFSAKLFPHAEFKATEFKQLGKNSYEALGHLTIRNKTVPVTLSFQTTEVNANKYSVEGTTTIKRSSFGVGQGDWANTDTVKDEVKVNFKLSATKKP